ncbi:MAG: preprotein translocase subunit YajC [Chitinophagaceae bacterium]|nr:MAG: preprotein translocase subunit YajC [Chitinophagaceae bacterium]
MYLLQAQPGGSGFSMIFMGLMILVFWLFFIRPQAKRQKQQKTFTEGIQPGDRVVTVAGIHGKINRVNDDGTINLEVSPGSYLKIEKSSISMEMSNALNKPAVTTEKKA